MKMADATLPAVIFASFVMFLGVIGNSVVCYICHCRLRRSVLNNFVLSLAALDLMGCVLCVPMEITELRNRLLTFDPALCISQRFFRNVHIICSVFVLVAIATERYRRICNPLSRHITLRQCRVAVVTALILAVLLSWPSLFIFGGRVTTFKTEAVPAVVPVPSSSSAAVTAAGRVPVAGVVGGGGGGEINSAVLDEGTEGRISPTHFVGSSAEDDGESNSSSSRYRLNDTRSESAREGRRRTKQRPATPESSDTDTINNNDNNDDEDPVTVVAVKSTECAVKDSMRGSAYPVVYFSFLFLLFFASSAVLCGLYARIACSIWRPRKLRTDTRTKSASLPDCRRLNAVFNNNNNNSNSNSNNSSSAAAAIAAIKAFHANQRNLRAGGGPVVGVGGNDLCDGGGSGGGDGLPLSVSGYRRRNNPETVPLTEVGGEGEDGGGEAAEEGVEEEETDRGDYGGDGDGGGVVVVVSGDGGGGRPADDVERGDVTLPSPADDVERRDVTLPSPADDGERRDVTLPRRASAAAQRLNAVFSAMTLPFKSRRDTQRGNSGDDAADVSDRGKQDLSRGLADRGDVTLPRPASRRRLNYSVFPKTSSLLRGSGRGGGGGGFGRGNAKRNSSGDGTGSRSIDESNGNNYSNRDNHTSTLPMPRRLYDELTRSLQLRRKRENTALSAMNVNSNYYINHNHNSSGTGTGSHINNLLLVVPTLSFRRKKRAAYSRKRTTFIMFLMTLTSVVSYLPFVLVSIAYVAASSIGSSNNNNNQQPWGHRSVAERAILDLCLKSFLISSAVNPLIYGFCNQRFKKECVKILEGLNRCRRRKVAVETEDTSDTPANT